MEAKLFEVSKKDSSIIPYILFNNIEQIVRLLTLHYPANGEIIKPKAYMY